MHIDINIWSQNIVQTFVEERSSALFNKSKYYTSYYSLKAKIASLNDYSDQILLQKTEILPI